jgi:fluoride ion exporter CrcB/FEX
MYPLRMTRSLAVTAGLACLALPSAASAAELNVSPAKRCYSSGESVNLVGSGFSPLGSASITRDGSPLGTLSTNSTGAFNGILTLAQSSGRKTKTYTATDDASSSLTASAQITVSAVRVDLSPPNGAPGRRMKVAAKGFTTGKTLWAHVTKGKSKRTLKIGRLSGACGGLTTRRRLLPRNAPVGVHTIQFDTFRKYNRKQPVSYRYTITVTRG